MTEKHKPVNWSIPVRMKGHDPVIKTNDEMIMSVKKQIPTKIVKSYKKYDKVYPYLLTFLTVNGNEYTMSYTERGEFYDEKEISSHLDLENYIDWTLPKICKKPEKR